MIAKLIQQCATGHHGGVRYHDEIFGTTFEKEACKSITMLHIIAVK